MQKHRRPKWRKLRISLLILSTVAFVAFVAFVVFAIVTERRRVESMAAIAVPPELVFHERLAEVIAHQGDNPEVLPPPEFQPVLDTLARWKILFQRRKEEIAPETLGALWERWEAAGAWEALSPEDISALQTFLDSHHDFVVALRETAAAGGPTRTIAGMGSVDVPPDWLLSIRDCIRLLVLDAIVRARSGTPDEAMNDCIAGFQFSDSLAAEPALTSQDFRYDLARRIFEAIQAAFPPGALGAEESARLLLQVQRAPGRESLLTGLKQDNLSTLAWVDHTDQEGWINYGKRASEILNRDESIVARAFFYGYASPLGRPWLNRDLTQINELMRHRQEIAELPYYEAKPRIDRQQQALSRAGYKPLARHYDFVAGYDALRLPAGYEARMGLLRIGLALERYAKESGTFPPSLNSLQVEFPDKTLIDPYSGDHFSYEPRERDFLLYSVGSNLTDEGGRHDLVGGDIVWRGTP